MAIKHYDETPEHLWEARGLAETETVHIAATPPRRKSCGSGESAKPWLRAPLRAPRTVRKT